MEESNQTKQTKESPPAEKNKMSPMIIVGVAIAIIVLVGGFLLTRGQAEQVSNITTELPQTQMEDESMMEGESMTEEDSMMEEDTMMEGEEDVEGMTENGTVVQVEGGAYYFDPNEIRVNAGDTVRIVFTNAGGMHDFVIDELNVQSELTQTGDTVEVEFSVDTPGEYTFYCSVANHRELGMEGALIVE